MNQCQKLEEKQKATDEAMKTYKAEMNALNAALTTYIARPPDPIPPPVLPDIDILVEALRPPIIASMREQIGPMLVGLRTEVEGMLESQTRQISKALLFKLTRVLKTERYIQEWLERESKGQARVQTDSTASLVNGMNGTAATHSDGHSPTPDGDSTPVTNHDTPKFAASTVILADQDRPIEEVKATS